MLRHALTVCVVLALRVCSPLPALNALAPSDGIAITQGIAYGDGPRRMLDVYAPVHATAPEPVVVFFYGGAWQVGMRKWHRYIGAALAQRGVVVIIPDYRQYPEVRFPAFVDDAARAVAWSRNHAAKFGGDPHRLFLLGHSVGGAIAALLAFDPAYLQAAGLSPDDLCGVVGLAGAYDWHPADQSAVPAIAPADWPRSRPINHVTAQAPPMLLVTGDDDKVVKPGNTLRLAVRLRAVGVPVATAIYPALDHMALMEALAGPLSFLAPVRQATLDFIAAQRDCAR